MFDQRKTIRPWLRPTQLGKLAFTVPSLFFCQLDRLLLLDGNEEAVREGSLESQRSQVDYHWSWCYPTIHVDVENNWGWLVSYGFLEGLQYNMNL